MKIKKKHKEIFFFNGVNGNDYNQKCSYFNVCAKNKGKSPFRYITIYISIEKSKKGQNIHSKLITSSDTFVT